MKYVIEESENIKYREENKKHPDREDIFKKDPEWHQSSQQ